MKRLLFFLMAIVFAMQGFSQATLNEGFEGTNFPPDDWARATTQGSISWQRYTSDAPRGTACASVNYEYGGHTNYLITPKLVILSDQDSISFWVKTDDEYSGTTLNILVSTTDQLSTSFGATSLLTISTFPETWTRYSVSLANYIGEEIHVAFKVVDDFGSRVMLDDVTGPELFVPACPKPTALSASNPTTTGIDLGWTDDTGLIWNIEYMLATETDWTNATTLYSVMNPHTFTSLNASTSYKARVQTDCGIEQSDWTSPITFMTACDAITVLPYSDSFDTYGTVTGSFPPCWSRPVLNTTTPFPSIHTTNNSAPASIKFQSSSASAPTYVITPQFADDINLLRVKFFLKREGANSGTMEIGVMSDPLDLTTFELVATVDPSLNDWIEYEFLFSGTDITGPNNYIAFKHVTSASNYYYWLDDVVVDYIPSCPKPTALTASNPTTIGIDLGWTDDVGSLWNIQYMLATETDWANATLISGATNPYTFTTLNPSTTYKVRVQSDCGAEQSEWSAIITFTTACGAITNLPYSETFDSYGTTSGSFVPCWSRPVLNTTTPWPSLVTTNHTPPASIKFQSASATTPTYVITPPFADDIETLRLRFWLRAESTTNSGTMQIGVMSDPSDTSTFELVSTIVPTTTTFQQYEFLLNNVTLTGPNNYIAFKHVTSASNYYYWLDDVVVDYIPSCPKPAALTATNITATDADLGWTDDAGSMWTIQYMLASETDWANATEIAGVASNPYPIIGLLSPASNYKFRVQSLCGAEESEWSNVATFTTPCVPLSQFPWTEGFESILAANTLPPCWSATSLGTKTGTIITTGNDYNRNARTGTGAAWFKWSCNDSFKTPEFQLTENTSYDFSFWYVTDGDDGWTSLKAELWDATSNTLVSVLGTPVLNPTNETYQIYSSTFTIPDETATYYIAIKCVATDVPYYLTLDDISLELTPDCPNVYGLTVGAASTTSVSVNWQDEGDDGSGYNLAYSSNLTTPFDPTTAIIIAVPTGTQLPYVIPGFSPGDSVWVSIQRGCLGNWTDYIKVILPESVNVLPFICDFEDPTINNTWTMYNGTQTNKWYIGSAGANGTTGNGLFISDNGTTAHYGTSSSSTTMASTLVEFDNSPEFVLSFDWKAGGDGEYGYFHYMDAYIIPIGVNLVPGTLPSNSYKVTPSPLLLSGGSWINQTISLGSEYSNTIQQIVFSWTNDDYPGIQPGAMVDNLEIVGITCPSTTDLVASEIGLTSAEISWESNLSSVADWWIYWRLNGESDWTDSVNVTTNPYTITGLLPSSSYQVVVVNNCGSELSYPMNVLSFNTLCDAITTLPWSENFDALASGEFPFCWHRPVLYNTYPKVSTYASDVHSAPSSLEIHSAVGIPSYAVMPQIDQDINTLRVKFWAKAESTTNSGTLEVGVMSDPSDTTTFEIIEIIQPTTTDYIEYEVGFSSTTLTGNNNFIAIRHNTVLSTWYYWIDDVVIDYIPACARPTQLNASNIQAYSADISWNPGNVGDAAWWLYYKEGVATSYDSIQITSPSPYTLSGLSSSTTYNYYLRTDCGTELSEASMVSSFSTPCLPVTTIPWSENFDALTSGEFPACWSRPVIYSTYPKVSTATTRVHSVPSSLEIHSAVGAPTYAITPQFSADINSLKVTFWAMAENTTNSGTLEVGVMSDPSDITTFESVEIIQPTSTAYTEYTVSFETTALTGIDNCIAFRQNTVSAIYYYWIDDVVVDYGNLNPCLPPSNITVTPSNITANMTWTAGGGEASWEVRLGETGTPETVSSTSHSLSGLTPSTTYTVYVRANCGTGYSSWIPKQFTTTDVPTPPTVTTAVPTTMISQTTAVFNGTYVQTTDAILTKGFEYKTAAATTWTNEVVTDGTTPFTFSPTGLIANTAYEVKAYVTTATFNTTYGNTVAFTTLAIVPPTVTTDSVKVLSETSATFYGKITQNTESIEARGFEYKLSSQAWADAINISATGVTTISATPTTLTTGSYNVRAYARTLAGTEYGQVLTFQTSGIDGIDGKEISIMMYPNPATSQTNLIVSGINGETKIILSDVQGRTLNTINAKPVSGKIEQTIDLNNLAKGVYYIRIQNSDINRTQKLIVK